MNRNSSNSNSQLKAAIKDAFSYVEVSSAELVRPSLQGTDVNLLDQEFYNSLNNMSADDDDNEDGVLMNEYDAGVATVALPILTSEPFDDLFHWFEDDENNNIRNSTGNNNIRNSIGNNNNNNNGGSARNSGSSNNNNRNSLLLSQQQTSDILSGEQQQPQTQQQRNSGSSLDKWFEDEMDWKSFADSESLQQMSFPATAVTASKSITTAAGVPVSATFPSVPFFSYSQRWQNPITNNVSNNNNSSNINNNIYDNSYDNNYDNSNYYNNPIATATWLTPSQAATVPLSATLAPSASLLMPQTQNFAYPCSLQLLPKNSKADQLSTTTSASRQYRRHAIQRWLDKRRRAAAAASSNSSTTSSSTSGTVNTAVTATTKSIKARLSQLTSSTSSKTLSLSIPPLTTTTNTANTTTTQSTTGARTESGKFKRVKRVFATLLESPRRSF